ncbi:MAG: pilus assembly protein TadG-related protein [Bdellovibrionales bacterium]
MMFYPFKKVLLGKLTLFAQSESGMTLPLLALSLLTLTGFTGLAIDVGRVQMVQSKLQFSVDAAGLAAGATVSTANTSTEFKKYLDVNFNNYMGSTLTGYSVSATDKNTVFKISATATMPTTFMAVLGVHNVTLTANSEIKRAITGLELVFVLDNTGSMGYTAGGGMTKLQALKNASTLLIDALFGGAATSTNGKLWVGIVPFAQSVSIGTSRLGWVGNRNATLNASWTGCIDARHNGYDLTDDPPSTGLPFTLFNLRSYVKEIRNLSTNAFISSTTVSSCAPGDNYGTNRKTLCYPTGSYAYATPLEKNASGSGPTYGQNFTCSLEMTPMTNDSSTLLTSIDAMVANGGTVINEGMVWAWRMLSPRWSGLWGGTMDANSLPLNYGTRGMAKAVVLLTDGQNTMYDTSQGAYWFAMNKWTGVAGTTGSAEKLDEKTLAICTTMKNLGIYVYTIGLGPANDINQTLLRNCATAENYYFYSPTTAELESVFNAIGDSLSNLRVSQ